MGSGRRRSGARWLEFSFTEGNNELPTKKGRPLCRLLIQQQRPVALYLRPVVDVVIIFIVSMHRQFETWVSIIVT